MRLTVQITKVDNGYIVGIEYVGADGTVNHIRIAQNNTEVFTSVKEALKEFYKMVGVKDE